MAGAKQLCELYAFPDIYRLKILLACRLNSEFPSMQRPNKFHLQFNLFCFTFMMNISKIACLILVQLCVSQQLHNAIQLITAQRYSSKKLAVPHMGKLIKVFHYFMFVCQIYFKFCCKMIKSQIAKYKKYGL